MSDSTERPTPPDVSFEDVDTYLQFIGALPDRANARVGRYIDPLTGERRNFKYDNLIVLAELHHLHDHLERVPSSADFEEHGEISIDIYQDRFGSYPRALEYGAWRHIMVFEYRMNPGCGELAVKLPECSANRSIRFGRTLEAADITFFHAEPPES